MKLSIIIVNYNVQYFLEQCLASVRKAVAHIPSEVFVVDNHSVDGSVDMVREKFPEVTLIANEINLGFSKANNQAIRQATGEYILLLNPDTVVEEDTFLKICQFMDSHADAGGLGVRMIDGKGNFLPESKRGLPSPSTAFFKMFGLSKIFPKSKIFGAYHLGYLPEMEIHQVDVLSGAFMLLRASILPITGLLDETYFMYAEDVDLSYQITKAGYKNYYYPETTIIHYKGESTKKGSLNYVFIFYNAMALFVRKNFSRSYARTFTFLINLAIWLRASLAICFRMIKFLMLPALDATFIYIAFRIFIPLWEEFIKDGALHLPESFLTFNLPVYITLWISGGFINRAYHKNISLLNIFRSIVTGTLFISVFYAFINESYRSSRAMIIFGTFISFLVFLGNRILKRGLGSGKFHLHSAEYKNCLILGHYQEAMRVTALLNKTAALSKIIGYISSEKGNENQLTYLGNLNEIHEVATIFDINEIIFCAKDINTSDMIKVMTQLQHSSIEFKMVPEESMYIIGSSSKDTSGDYYSIHVRMDILNPKNSIIKRAFDVVSSIMLLILSPLLLPIQKKPIGYVHNILKVLRGEYTWIGYRSCEHQDMLPGIRQGILNTATGMEPLKGNGQTAYKLNLLYAKDYSVEKDMLILIKGIRCIGGSNLYGQ